MRTPCSNVTFLSTNPIDQNLAKEDKKFFHNLSNVLHYALKCLGWFITAGRSMQMKDKMVFDVNMLASNKIMATTARKITIYFFFLNTFANKPQGFVCLSVCCNFYTIRRYAKPHSHSSDQSKKIDCLASLRG